MAKYVSKENLQYNVGKTKEYVQTQLEEKQDVLVSGENIKTINNTSLLGSGNLDVRTYQAFPSSWSSATSSTTDNFCATVDADASAVEGMAYLGELRCSDFGSSGVGIINGEAIVEIFAGSGTSGKTIHITLSSGDTSPYRWEYTYWASGNRTSGWIGFQTKLNTIQMNAVNSGITSEIVADIVNKSGNQIITGTKTISDTSLDIQKTNITGDAKWHLEEDQYGQLVISRTYNNSKAKMLQFNGSNILPEGNNSNLGSTNKLWNNLYLSGNLTDGTNSISVEEIKNYYGFRAITAPSSTTLTNDEIDIIIHGCVVRGGWNDLSVDEDITFFPAFSYSNSYRGICFYRSIMYSYYINTTNNVIQLGASTDTVLDKIANIRTQSINNKTLPNYPSDMTKTYNYQQVNGTLSWTEAPSNATYDKLGLIKLGSDTQATQAVQTVTSTANRQYALQTNGDGRASVNIPWTDTTYTAGTGLDLTGTEFSVDNNVVAFQSDLPTGEVDITLNGTTTQTTEVLNNIVVDDKTYTLTSTRQTPASGGTTLSLVNTGDMYTWNNKQDTLTFDNVPTQNSDNPVKSSGIYTALSGKQDTLTAGNNITIENNVISSTTQTILNGVAYREI